MSTKKKKNKKKPVLKGCFYTFNLPEQDLPKILDAMKLYKTWLIADMFDCIQEEQMYPIEANAHKLGQLESDIDILEHRIAFDKGMGAGVGTE